MNMFACKYTQLYMPEAQEWLLKSATEACIWT